METTSRKISHIKAILIGGGVVGIIGAGIGYLAGLTVEGAGCGFVLGWIIGEIFGAASVQGK